jgi:hypothetical protein
VSLGRTPAGTRTHQIANFEYDGSNNVIYAGYAVPGTADSDPLWLIFKYTWTAGNCVSIRVADGLLDYGSVWNDRAALTYS